MIPGKERAKEYAKIIAAYIDGKVIECYSSESKGWKVITGPDFDFMYNEYRIQPESRYRPFESQKECWDEMQKHTPFGWVKHKIHSDMTYIVRIFNEASSWDIETPVTSYTFKECLEDFIFADGTPFGIKEDNND